MQTLFGLIFDMDGVLVDSGAAHLRAWQQLGTEIGTAFSRELFRRTFGQRNASIIPQWLGPVPPQRLAELEGRKESLYRHFVRQGSVRVFSRVPELLVELRELGMRVAVASSGPRANVALLIDVIGAGNVIDATVASEDVREGKPHPEAFLTAAQRLGVAPACCAVVEDSVHGIEAAKRAGMLAVAVLTSTAREQLTAAGADMVVDEVGDLQAHDLALLVRR
jgi:beta-phosphoglucomutase